MLDYSWFCLEFGAQQSLSAVHSIQMEKLAKLVRVGGARPFPFTTFTITYKVAVYAPAEWADTLFHLYLRGLWKQKYSPTSQGIGTGN
jgi:hypothetical protein